MKRKKKVKTMKTKDVVKPETTWQIVRNEDGSYHWFKAIRRK